MTLSTEELARRIEAEQCRFELTGEGYAAVLVAILDEYVAEQEARRNERRQGIGPAADDARCNHSGRAVHDSLAGGTSRDGQSP